MQNRIYIDELGYRDAIKDGQQIIWFIEQKGKAYKTKSATSAYWNNCLDRYEKALFQYEAFEVLNFLKSKTTDKKRAKRHKDKIIRDIQQKIQIEKDIDDWREQRNLRSIVAKGFSLN